MITEFAAKFKSKGVTLVIVNLPYFLEDHRPRSRADNAFMMARLTTAGIPIFNPAIPRKEDGSIEVSHFFIATDHFRRIPITMLW